MIGARVSLLAEQYNTIRAVQFHFQAGVVLSRSVWRLFSTFPVILPIVTAVSQLRAFPACQATGIDGHREAMISHLCVCG